MGLDSNPPIDSANCLVFYASKSRPVMLEGAASWFCNKLQGSCIVKYIYIYIYRERERERERLKMENTCFTVFFKKKYTGKERFFYIFLF